jgi:hypothetical protein
MYLLRGQAFVWPLYIYQVNSWYWYIHDGHAHPVNLKLRLIIKVIIINN